MEWAWFLNSNHNLTYPYAFGDKDMFHIAFELAGKRHAYNMVSAALESTRCSKLCSVQDAAHLASLATTRCQCYWSWPL